MMPEEKLFDIFEEDFTKKYGSHQVLLCLKNLQHIYNTLYPHSLIEHANIMNAFEQEGTDLKQQIIDSILHQLPKKVGSMSVLAVNVGDHWTSMVLYRSEDMIHVRYSDSSGTEMPSILNTVLRSELIAKAFLATPDHLDIKDYRCKVDGGHDSCGSKTIEQIAKMIENPHLDQLESQPIRDYFHNKLIRAFDVLFASSFVQNIQTDMEKEILLNMFYVRCNIKSIEVFDGNVSFIDFNAKNLIAVFDGTVKTLYAYLLSHPYKDEELLKSCIDKVPHIADHRGDIIADQICQALLRKFEEVSQHLKVPNTPARHGEAAGGGSEEHKESIKEPQFKKYNLDDGAELQVYNDRIFLFINGKKHDLLFEEDREGMKCQTFKALDNDTCIGVLWVGDKPELIPIEELGYEMVELGDSTANKTDL